MKRRWLTISIIVGFIILLAACAPKVELTPQATPSVPTVTPTGSISTPASASQEEIEWNKVVVAAQKEGRLNAYSYNMTGDAGIAVSRSFEAKYGVKVDIITGGGAALAERIKTEKRTGTVVADVMDTNTFMISNIKNIGATISAEDLPALKEKGVWLVEPSANDPEKHKLIHSVTYPTIAANASLLKSSDEPRSVKELALPKWKGRITGTDPRQSSGYYIYFLSFLRRNLIDLDTLQALGKNDIAWTPTTMDTVQNLIRGQYPLCFGVGTSVFAQLLVTEPSLPVKLLDMEEGVVVNNLAIALIKDSPHPNAAKLLVNWMFTPEGQKVFAGAKGMAAVRKDIPDFTPGRLRMTPTKLIVPSADEEDEAVRLFQEGYLAKLWGR